VLRRVGSCVGKLCEDQSPPQLPQRRGQSPVSQTSEGCVLRESPGHRKEVITALGTLS
jgi:hypothetical protein